jgi:hypothetical protein
MENLEQQSNLTNHSHFWNWISAIALVISIVSFGFIYTQISSANADYICTYIVEENDPCGNGSWSSWADTSTTGDSAQCTQRTEKRRVYTGTRETRHILQYLNLRTACDSGYSQAGHGGGGGASGFHGGSIISETAVCQIEEIRITEDSPSCVPVSKGGSGGSGGSGTNITTSNIKKDLELKTNSTSISAKSQLNQFRESKIAAQISVDKELVNKGTAVTVSWQTVEMTSCTVTGSNGDSWSGTAGEQLSKPLEFVTTFTLDCTAFNNTKVQESVEVKILPK